MQVTEANFSGGSILSDADKRFMNQDQSIVSLTSDQQRLVRRLVTAISIHDSIMTQQEKTKLQNEVRTLFRAHDNVRQACENHFGQRLEKWLGSGDLVAQTH